jgi:hypothetical protein
LLFVTALVDIIHSPVEMTDTRESAYVQKS